MPDAMAGTQGGKFAMDASEVVYVGNIPKSATTDEVAEVFTTVGNVIRVSFMRENRNDCRTKVGFVLFESEVQALEACTYDQTMFQSHRLVVLLSNDEREFCADYTIIIQNTSSDTSEEDLYEACSRYGPIDTVQIPTNNYAFVSFRERSAAHAAQRKLHNSYLKKQKVSVMILDDAVPVRLEDFDSFKTPRVYKELLYAKMSYNRDRHLKSFKHTRTVDCTRMIEEIDTDLRNGPAAALLKDDPDSDLDAGHHGDLDYEGEYEGDGVVVYRRELSFCKTYHQSTPNAAVRVENIPREVYDVDVIKYFESFGPIMSVNRGYSLNTLFNKCYTIVYLEQKAQERVIEIFRRQVELSGIPCVIFTLLPGETLKDDREKSVLLDYVSHFIQYDDIVDAFQHIGEVLFVQKTVRNRGPTVVHFRHPVSIDEVSAVSRIDGDHIQVEKFSRDAFKKFKTQTLKLKNRSLVLSDKPAKLKRHNIIIQKELREREESINFKTAFNPVYRNPDPSRYSFEVAIYNCPAGTKLQQLRDHFAAVAHVLAMRHETSRFDSRVWKVYASFGSYLEAFRAVRYKRMLTDVPIFKYIAAESPKLDTKEVVKVQMINEDCSVTQLYASVDNIGTVNFVDKIDDYEFIVIFRDMKAAMKATGINRLRPFPDGSVIINSMRQLLRNKWFEAAERYAGEESDEYDEDGEMRDQKRPVFLLDEIVKLSSSQDMSNGESRHAGHIKSAIVQSTGAHRSHGESQVEHDLRNYLSKKRTSRNDTKDLEELEELERKIRERERDIERRLEILDRQEARIGTTPRSSSSKTSTIRSSSTGDPLVHERLTQIREEKTALSRELHLIRLQDCTDSARFAALRERQSELDKEQRTITLQLEAKQWFSGRDNSVGNGGNEENGTASAIRSKRSTSRSLSPPSPPRRKQRVDEAGNSVSQSRRRARSRSPRFRRRSTSPSRSHGGGGGGGGSSGQHRQVSSSSAYRRTMESLEREMNNLGRRHQQKQPHSVYVANISSDYSERELEDTFSRFGCITNMDCERLAKYNEVYIDYQRREMAFRALDMNGVKVNGRRLRVTFNNEKQYNREGYSVIVQPKHQATESTIFKSFNQFGEIDFIWNPPQSRMATVAFRRSDSVKRAMGLRELIDHTPIRMREFKDRHYVR